MGEVSPQDPVTDGVVFDDPLQLSALAAAVSANIAPAALEIFISTRADAAVQVDLFTHVVDPDVGDTLRLVSLSPVGQAFGALSDLGGGVVEFSPFYLEQLLRADETVEETFRYTVSDAAGATASATITFSISGAGSVVAEDDRFTAAPGEVLGGDLLENDHDPENHHFELTGLGGVEGQFSLGLSHGMVVAARNGAFTYLPYETAPAGGYEESFTYQIGDTDGAAASAEVTIEAVSAIGEVGQISMNQFGRLVELQRSYDDPVVVLSVAGLGGASAIAPRVFSMEGDSLAIFFQETPQDDFWHMWETISYMVVERGAWALTSGLTLEAGTIDTNHLPRQGFEQVRYTADFGAQAPVTLSQVQSYNGHSYVTTRQKAADADGFQLALEEEEAGNAGGHAAETVGWIAMEAGAAAVNGAALEAGRVSGVNQAGATQDFESDFLRSPVLLTQLSSYNGADAAQARVRAGDADGFEVFAQEDLSADAETAHAHEDVDYLAFGAPGLLYGWEI